MLPNFPTIAIDRDTLTRSDKQLMAEYLRGPQSRTLLWFDNELIKNLNQSFYFEFNELSEMQLALSEPLYLGEFEGQRFFTRALECWDDGLEPHQLLDLRKASFEVTEHHLGLLFQAQGLMNWHLRHAFCSYCGSSMHIEQSGYARCCDNAECGKTQYPKLDPAVIFSIVNSTQGESRILLGRKPQWDEGRYSVLAGFVEPGESLEGAVRREALEEVGIEIDSLQYINSQPWPFPDALMMGFECQSQQNDIQLIDDELQHAAWFNADEIVEKVQRGKMKLPYPLSLSWHLLDRWFYAQTGYSLKQI